MGERIEVSLVLQGGGALGAYEWGAITALLDRMDAAERDRGDTVALTGVTGVSIGAVNAACLVGSTDRDDARARLRNCGSTCGWTPRRCCPHSSSATCRCSGCPASSPRAPTTGTR